MSLAMSPDRRAAFLAEVRLGVLTVGGPGRAPLPTPVWYDVDAAGHLSVITGASSQKGAAITAARRFTITVFEEQRPFRYVSVEGALVEQRACELERDLLPMAIRYLGDEAGRAYGRLWSTWGTDDAVYVMRPDRWGSADHTTVYEHVPG